VACVCILFFFRFLSEAVVLFSTREKSEPDRHVNVASVNTVTSKTLAARCKKASAAKPAKSMSHYQSDFVSEYVIFVLLLLLLL